MALFDALIAELGKRFNLEGRAAPLIRETLRMITESPGGLGGFLDRFKEAGLGGLVTSWLGTGENLPLQPSQLDRVLGTGFVEQIGRRIGLSASALAAPVAFLIPRLVDMLTPKGEVPAALPAEARAMLTAEPATAVAAKGSSNKLWWILGLLALLGIAGYFSWYTPTGKVTTAGTSTVTPSPVAQLPAKLSITNANNQIRYGGTVNNEATRDSIVATLKEVFGEGNISGLISVDPNFAPAVWFDKLKAALHELKIPGVEAVFDGKGVFLGGLPDGQITGLQGRLRAIFGEDFIFGSLGDRAMAAIASARDATLAALGQLKAGFTGADLVKALNLAIINFETDSATVATDGRALLEKIAASIKAAPPTTVIEIDGHTDSTGDPAANQLLSEQRAQSVRAILIENGVPEAMIVTHGFGDTHPVASNDTPDGRFKNRRIEFVVVQ